MDAGTHRPNTAIPGISRVGAEVWRVASALVDEAGTREHAEHYTTRAFYGAPFRARSEGASDAWLARARAHGARL
jgi:hypothetical protein